MPILAFLVSIAYLPGISGIATAPRWALLSICVPVMLIVSRPLRVDLHVTSWAPQYVLGGLFMFYAVISMFWVTSSYEALDALWKLTLLGMIFVLGSKIEDMKPVYMGFAIGIGLNSLVMIGQKLGYTDIQGAGLFWNPNLAGEAAALIIVATFSEKMWYPLVASWPSLILSGARGAILGTACAFVMWLWSRQRTATIVIIGISIAVVAVTLPLGKGSSSILQRLDLWADVVQQLTLLGHGVGQFIVDFPKGATHVDNLTVHFDHAHNDILELAFDFGIFGLLCAVALAYTVFRKARETEFLVLTAFVVMGLVGFPLFEPATAFFTFLCAGYACRYRINIRNAVNQRGVGVLPGREVPHGV